MWNGCLQTENSLQKIGLISMKAASLLFCLLFPMHVFARNIGEDCTYEGIRLFGRVQVVTGFADIDVQKKDALADLDVRFVNAFPDACGEWQLVDSFPDFTVRFVDSFPDITIKKVHAFAGVR